MVAKKITSLQHPLVKRAVELRTNRAYREEAKEVLVIGKKMTSELLLKTLFSTEPSKGAYLVTEEILQKITGMKSNDGFAAIVALPEPEPLQKKAHLVIFDELSDPGNLGTLVRTALAFGWDGIVLTPNTVDLFNDKTIRASKGAVFKLPYMYADYKELASWKRTLLIADLDGEPLDKASFDTPLALVLSNEGRGARDWAKGSKITIPMSGKMESLNVASSGAILLYAMRPK